MLVWQRKKIQKLPLPSTQVIKTPIYMEHQTEEVVEDRKELTELENVLDSTDWVRLKTELEAELLPSGNRGTCDVVGMRIAKKINDAGLDIRPVPVVIPGETEIISLEHAHVAFVLKIDKLEYLIDFTYGFYVPIFNQEKTETSIRKPFVIVPYSGSIPIIDGVEMYRAMSDNLSLILVEDVKIQENDGEEYDQETEMMKASLLATATREYDDSSTLQSQFSLEDYLRIFVGINLDEQQNKLAGETKQLMDKTYLKMKQYLKEGICDSDVFRERWIDDLKSQELNNLIEKMSLPKTEVK